MMDLISFKKQFDPILEEFVSAKIREIRRYSHDHFILSLVNHGKSLLKTGKRIRPYLAYVMYRSAGGKNTWSALQLFVFIELIHTFLLIHDDVIDRGRERRGVVTAHVFAANRLKKRRALGDHVHLGEGLAVVLGDLLYSWAVDLLQSSRQFPVTRLLAVQKVFAVMMDEVIVGEMIDVVTSSKKRISDQLLRTKLILKTARYSFVRPMQIGVALAGKSERLIRFSERFGTSVGLAFQIQDDLFDLAATPWRTNKTVFTDLQTHQHTVFTQYILDHGSANERKKLKKYFGKPVKVTDRRNIIQLFEKSGAVAYGQAMIAKYLASAKQAVAAEPLSLLVKNQMLALVNLIRGRTS